MQTISKTPQPFCNTDVATALSRLKVTSAGLSNREAANRLKQYGPNKLKANSGERTFLLLLSQFKSPITLLLIIAAFIAVGLRDKADSVIILAIVLISGVLGFWQEKGAANAVSKLMKMVQLNCIVIRDGQMLNVPSVTIVPGDIIKLAAGDMIPGDSLLLTTEELFVDEAAFTGETFPVEKKCGVVPINTPLAKKFNTLFMGSHVISGTASALITNTGMTTEFGKISASLQGKIPETDFERGVRKFGYLLMEITLLLVLVIFALNVWLQKPVLDSFLFSLAIAVGLTPQLLPAIVSVNLAAGAQKMARKKVIVKRLSAIENFGSMDMLCTDKTGTITAGKVTLKDTIGYSGQHSDRVLYYAWLNAVLQQGFHNPIDEAICTAYGTQTAPQPLVAEIPYDFLRKMLTVQVKENKRNLAITKGALKSVLEKCSHLEIEGKIIAVTPEHQNTLLKKYQQLSGDGYRVLGLAYKILSDDCKITRRDEEDMIFMGFITLFDPLKPDSISTITQLNNLNVQLKIITGDNELIGKHLALQLNIPDAKILTGGKIRQMNNTALAHAAPLTHIFAEVEPNQKERIVTILKKAGYVVGFMGDGINDAPALHAADVGISINTAVDVAKEAADIVLLKPGLHVLIDGIMEGRKTFANTMKYIFMATSANFGNMFSMAGASLFLPFLPLLPKQVLLNNLLTDFPEMAIAGDKVDEHQLTSPQRWDMSFIRKFMITFGLLSSVFDYITFGCLILIFHTNEQMFQTGWFTESVISAVVIVLVVRTRKAFFQSMPGNLLILASLMIIIVVGIIPLSPLSAWFNFIRLPLAVYGFTIFLVIAYMITAELVKYLFYRKLSKHLIKKHTLDS
ncbi:magnesium-translocating P-type ATPase [Mucilaginibacter puniceus]